MASFGFTSEKEGRGGVTMSYKTYTRTDIRHQWIAFLEKISISDDRYRIIKDIIDTYQIPATYADFESALRMYADDKQNALRNMRTLSNTIYALRSRGLQHMPAKAMATQYPVFYALTQPKFFGDTTPHKRRLRWCLQALMDANDERADPSIFYNDVLAARDVLLAMEMQISKNMSISTSEPIEILRYCITQTEANPANVPMKRKWKRARDLIEGYRSLGERQRRASPGGGGRGPARPRDVGLMRRIGPTQPGRARKQGDNDGRGGARAVGVGISGFAEVAAPDAARGHEGDPTLEVQRQRPSLATRVDDQLAMRRGSRVAATAGLAGIADAHRLPQGLVIHAMAIADRVGPASWALVVLLLATGMPVRRLLRLRRARRPGSDEPHWDATTACVSYTLRDGPMASAHGDNRRIRLILPEPLQAALAATGGPRPFAGVAWHLARRLKTGSRRNRGPTPTLHRLRATAWAYVRHHARDAVTASTVGGEFGQTLAAPAAYRRLPADELQQTFSATLSTLAHAAQTSDWAPAAWTHDVAGLAAPVPQASSRRIGSVRAHPPSVFRAWITQLRGALAWRLPGLQTPALAEIDTCITIYNIWSCHTYLGLLLATGMRPIGDVARVVATPDDWIISDKASAYYRERRLVPDNPSVRREIRAHKEKTQHVFWNWFGYKVKMDFHEYPHSLIPWFLVRQNGVVTVRRLQHTLFLDQAYACNIDINALSRNATRHAFATFMREQLPESDIDSLLGHVRAGVHASAPGTLARHPGNADVRNAIDLFLNQAGFTEIAEWMPSQ